MIGAVIDNLDYDIRTDALLFGESQSRIVISCSKKAVKEIKNIARKNKAPCHIIGMTGGEKLKILNGKKELINLPLEKLLREWSGSLEKKLGNDICAE
jgi:phosphoribosylformylglycinamidine synthase